MAPRQSKPTTPVAPGDDGMVARLGPVEVDIPRSVGYFGGIGLAVALGILEPPLGLFIAAIPFVKMVTRPGIVMPLRVTGQLLDGMSRPVGGEGDGYVRLVSTPPKITGRGRPTRQGARS